MLFNSLTFIVFLRSFSVSLTPFRPGECKNPFFLSQVIFFAAWNPPFVILLWLSTLVDWYVAKALADEDVQVKRRLLLTVSLAVNLGLLGFFLIRRISS